MKIRTDHIRQEENEIEPPRASALPEGAFFLLIALIITLFGLSVLYSTSFAQAGTGFFYKQLMWTGVGAVVFLFIVLVGHRTLAAFSPLLLAGLFILLLIPLIQHRGINGAYRWIVLPHGIRIQPSEFAKVIMVLFWGDYLARHTRDLETRPWSVAWRIYISMFAVCGLIFAGKDMGTTALVALVFFSLLFVGGMRWYYTILFPAGGVLAFALIGYSSVQNFLARTGLMPAYRLGRIISYTNPELYAEKEGYQLWFSQLALGSGKWFGLGFTESRLKLKYLPEAHTDFILSIVGEELGFVFILAVMVAYVLLVFTGFLIAHKARTRQGMLLAFGMSAFIGLQAFINIGVICGALPTKGMPAPMISYGGSSLISCMAAVAVVFSVALDTSYPDYPVKLWRKFTRKPGDPAEGKEDLK